MPMRKDMHIVKTMRGFSVRAAHDFARGESVTRNALDVSVPKHQWDSARRALGWTNNCGRQFDSSVWFDKRMPAFSNPLTSDPYDVKDDEFGICEPSLQWDSVDPFVMPPPDIPTWFFIQHDTCPNVELVPVYNRKRVRKGTVKIEKYEFRTNQRVREGDTLCMAITSHENDCKVHIALQLPEFAAYRNVPLTELFGEGGLLPDPEELDGW